MSRRNKNGPKLELKLNLSPPPSQAEQISMVQSPSRSNTTASPSSCVSSETNQEEMETSQTTISMVLVGCPRCLMYVMLSQDSAKCPKCKSTVLLDFFHENASATTTTPAVTTKRNKKFGNCLDC
ncbi:Protein GL2-INTERACTING REPRESSOR 2 [Hirschfeldia incana]|nr:Protein GL2-INTERACTING REPRESSOR 2 [Hirschfeldia incana]